MRELVRRAPRPAVHPVRGFLDRLRAGIKAYADTGTGVSFVGPAEHIVRLWSETGAPVPDAEQLTRALAFATSAYCYGAMQWRASRVAEPPLMVVRETAEGEEWQRNHPLAELLDAPRPDVDMGELLALTLLYWDHSGAALWVLDADQLGERRLITPFSQEQFKSAAAGPLIYGSYDVLTANGGWKPVDRTQVIHFRDPSPLSWRTSPSRVDVALAQLDLGHQTARIVRHYLASAMFPGGLISPDKDWHPEQDEWDLWVERFQEWYGGPRNAGKPLALPGGTTFAKTALGLTDLIPDKVLDRVEATVGSVFGVPPVVLGWLTGLQNSPWSQMAEARRAAYEDTIAPLWHRIERRLGQVLLSQDERAAGLLIRFDTRQVVALRADEEVQSRIAALQADVATLNERRLRVGLSQLPPDDPRGQEITGIAKLDAAGLGAVGLGDAAAGKDATAKMDSRDLGWLVFDLATKAGEGSWERPVYAYLQDLKVRVAALARRELADVGKAAKDAKDSTDTDRAHRFQHHVNDLLLHERVRIAELTHPLLLATGTMALRRLAVRQGLSFAVLEPGLAKYALEEAAYLADVMGEATGHAVAAAVQAGLNAGETVGPLTQRLEGLSEFSRTRARLVARTETTRAWNGAQRRGLSEYARSSGSAAEKSWLSARDDRVREEHQALDDETWIPIDATFANGLQQPGEPNCRCTLLYRLADAGAAE